MERAERVCGLRKERTNMATTNFERIIASITRWHFHGEIQNDWCHISEKMALLEIIVAAEFVSLGCDMFTVYFLVWTLV